MKQPRGLSCSLQLLPHHVLLPPSVTSFLAPFKCSLQLDVLDLSVTVILSGTGYSFLCSPHMASNSPGLIVWQTEVYFLQVLFSSSVMPHSSGTGVYTMQCNCYPFLFPLDSDPPWQRGDFSISLENGTVMAYARPSTNICCLNGWPKGWTDK